MRRETILKEYERLKSYIPELGEHHVLTNWLRSDDDKTMIDMAAYGRLLKLLPDHIVENLERSRLSQDGKIAMFKAGQGYTECLFPAIVDGGAVGGSAAEARLIPALVVGKNYLQPSGLPGRTLRMTLRGRITTLATAATLTFRWRDALTDVLTTNTLAASGALTMDTTIQTATMWKLQADLVVRSVGTAGTVFVMGDVVTAAQAFTLANAQAQFMGSAGSATPATVAIDLTADRFFNWTATWSLATAYSIQAHQAFFEALN